MLDGGGGADSFVFHDGSDLVTDFKANQGNDVFLSELLFDPNAISASPAPDAVWNYASLTGRNMVFDFGNGNMLTFQGVSVFNDATIGGILSPA